jgi:hypothetical protein
MILRLLLLVLLGVAGYLFLQGEPGNPPDSIHGDGDSVASDPALIQEAAIESGEPRRERAVSGVVATTASASVLSFEGHLEQRVIDSTRPKQPSSDATRSVASAVSNRTWNPEGKILTVAQEQELQRRLNEHNEAVARLESDEVDLRRDAFLQAVKKGQSDVELTVMPSAVMSHTEADAANRKIQRERMERMEARLGAAMRDWAYVAMGTIEPDMVARSVIIYTTKEQAPALFDVRRRMVEAGHSLHRDMSQFFLGIR